MGLFAGIDVAKDTLAVAVSSGQEWSCANDPRGITLLVERLEAANPALVVLEATGGYEEELLAALIAAGIENAAGQSARGTSVRPRGRTIGQD
jgi:transposase